MSVNTQDPNEHCEVFLNNIARIQEYLREIKFDAQITENIYSYIRDNHDELFSMNGRVKLAELQKNLGALLVLINIQYDFSKFGGNILTLHKTATEYMREEDISTSTDISVMFPKMVDDAIESIFTNGAHPTKEKMQSAVDYFVNKIITLIQEGEGVSLNPSQERFFHLVDAARGRIGKKFDGRELTDEERQEQYVLYARVDTIMNSKDSIETKISILQTICIN